MDNATPGSAGWPPHGMPPSGPGVAVSPPEPPKKSRVGLYVGLGCGGLALLTCMLGAGIGYAVSLLGPGETVASTTITPGVPYTLTYVQEGDQRYEAWLEIDIHYSNGYNLTGTFLLSENNVAFDEYTLADDGSGSAVPEHGSSTRMNWVTFNANGNGNASGKVSLYPIPARASGSTVTITGMINAAPGTTGTIRLLIAEE